MLAGAVEAPQQHQSGCRSQRTRPCLLRVVCCPGNRTLRRWTLAQASVWRAQLFPSISARSNGLGLRSKLTSTSGSGARPRRVKGIKPCCFLTEVTHGSRNRRGKGGGGREGQRLGSTSVSIRKEPNTTLSPRQTESTLNQERVPFTRKSTQKKKKRPPGGLQPARSLRDRSRRVRPVSRNRFSPLQELKRSLVPIHSVWQRRFNKIQKPQKGPEVGPQGAQTGRGPSPWRHPSACQRCGRCPPGEALLGGLAQLYLLLDDSGRVVDEGVDQTSHCRTDITLALLLLRLMTMTMMLHPGVHRSPLG